MTETMSTLYLGLDSSTQSLTAMVVEAGTGEVVFEHSIDFDDELPQYGTRNGVLPSENPTLALAPPLMWAEALERMFAAIAAGDLDLARLAAIGGSAQQHGSVYLRPRAAGVLATLDAERPLAGQIAPALHAKAGEAMAAAVAREETTKRKHVDVGPDAVRRGKCPPGYGIFSRPVSPVWMDSSTTEECAEITEAIGGADRLAQITGSRAFERFTGPQIRKFYKQDPSSWGGTALVHLVSSFLASLLTGGHAPLEPGDASGMNLMDLRTRDWSMAALEATAFGLDDRLPPIVPSSTVIGALSPYWRQRFGLPAARVVAFSGDNPCSLIGTGLFREGQVAVSLGTSDTIFGPMREPRVDPSGTGHVFGAPTGDYMGLTCFRNGGLARERVRDEHGLDWEGFSAALRDTPPGNGGALMFPWFEAEITPHVPDPGVRRVDLDPGDAARNVRAVIEAQMMALANHSRWTGVDIDVIHATGGAAVNEDILQVMADVFDAEVRRFEVSNSACLGAALRARHADALASGDELPWADVVRGIAEPVAGTSLQPIPQNTAVYADLRRRYAELEAEAVDHPESAP